MKLVKLMIKLPEEIYKEIKDTDRLIVNTRSGKTFIYTLWNAVKNGIPIPTTTRQQIIDGLQFTIDMCLMDTNTGDKYKEPINELDKITVDSCRAAIELLTRKEEI